MADLRCPMCGKPNPQEADACRFCGARLKPMDYGKGKAPAAPPPAGQPGGADWMSDLRGDMMRNRPKTSMLPPEPPAPAPSDDWLNKIDSRDGQKPASPPAPPARTDAVRRSAPPASPAAPQEGGGEPPAWLSKVRAQVTANRDPEPSSGSGKEEGEPVWLKRLRARRTQDDLSPEALASEAEGEAAPGEMPDWLSKVRDQSTGGPAAPGMEEPGFPPAPFSGAAPEESGPPSASSPWGKPAPTQRPKPAQETSKHTAGGENPDWLKYPSDTGGFPPAEPPLGGSDWMGSMTSAIEETPPNPSAAVPGAPSRAGTTGRPSAGSLLGMKDPAASSRPPGKGAPAKTGGFVRSTSPFTESPPPSPGSPGFGSDWNFPADTPAEYPFPPPIGDAAQPPTTTAFHGGSEPMIQPSGEEGLPDWLADAQGETAVPQPEPELEAPLPTPDLNELLRPDTMPEWLKKPTGAEAKDKPGEGLPAGAALPENLEQAELPRWLEAMRPIQSVAVPTDDEERVESVGPLAGLRGVLSAEPVVAMPRRPGIMAGNIDALPAQMALTDTLRRMLIEPEVRAARKPMRAMLLTPVIRKVMSGVLILAILLPMLTGSLFTNAVYQPQANIQAGELVNALPPERPVLVAFEYDASTAPEIETGATVLLEHLARRGITTVFISSQPNGTMLGDGLRLENEKLGTAMPPLAADLGYVAGGAGGLRRLGGELSSVIQNPGLDWTAAPLSSIHSVSDFSMILLFAASPQSVRDWVEQVHTAAPDTPIVAMISASSDALVFPYTQGSNPAIRGLVTGYAGAQAYRVHFLPDTLKAEGVAAMRWQAFGSGTLALLLTLSAGIIGSLVLGFIRRDRKAAG
jgi:hypothetical protein